MASSAMTPEEKRSFYRKQRLTTVIAVFVLSCGIVFLLHQKRLMFADNYVKMRLAKYEAALNKLNKYCREGRLSPEQCSRYYKQAKDVYASIKNDVSLMFWRGHKDWKVYGILVAGIWGVLTMCFVYPYRVLKRHQNIFFRKPTKEVLFKPKALPKPMFYCSVHGLDEEWVISEFFKSKDDWEMMWRAFNDILIADEVIWEDTGKNWEEVREEAEKQRKVVLDLPNINREIKSYVDEMVFLGRINGTIMDEASEKRFRFIIGFTLFHFVTIFFGNVSTALLSRFIKDYTLKRVLAVYISGCTIIPEQDKDAEPSEFLYILQSYRKLYKEVLVELEDKFSYIPQDYVVYRALQKKKAAA